MVFFDKTFVLTSNALGYTKNRRYILPFFLYNNDVNTLLQK